MRVSQLSSTFHGLSIGSRLEKAPKTRTAITNAKSGAAPTAIQNAKP